MSKQTENKTTCTYRYNKKNVYYITYYTVVILFVVHCAVSPSVVYVL